MSPAIRAIYEDGHLRLLDPVELVEGEQVQITIQHQPGVPLTENGRMRAALGNSVHFPSPAVEHEEIDAEALQQELDTALRGLSPVSEYIIQERREGP